MYTCIQIYVYTPFAPLGLGSVSMTVCYTPVAPLVLRERGRGDLAPTECLNQDFQDYRICRIGVWDIIVRFKGKR